MTAPALPGAAPDPAPGRNDTARLPPEVEKARLVLRRKMAECGVYGEIFDVLWSFDVAPILAALGGDGEPVAWGYGIVRPSDGLRWSSLYHSRTDAELVIAGCPVGHYVVVPLYTRPAATGAEVERAVREAAEQEREACARIVRAFREQYEPGDDARLTLEQAEHDILARGAKS